MAQHSERKFDTPRQDRRRMALARFSLKSGGDEEYVKRKEQERESLTARIARGRY